ncbi:hypothetical protein PB2503_11374 [Parvularcula bermudensis HTCC2503]|uniref:Uncharacterized protein n=2 Tax=Parvularcula TaxID=208215 RepID=E0TCG6_PARBH|nr:hypothetical protein PB2503_11374 [Parvularcula bermudensis HTCC2503]
MVPVVSPGVDPAGVWLGEDVTVTCQVRDSGTRLFQLPNSGRARDLDMTISLSAGDPAGYQGTLSAERAEVEFVRQGSFSFTCSAGNAALAAANGVSAATTTLDTRPNARIVTVLQGGLSETEAELYYPSTLRCGIVDEDGPRLTLPGGGAIADLGLEVVQISGPAAGFTGPLPASPSQGHFREAGSYVFRCRPQNQALADAKFLDPDPSLAVTTVPTLSVVLDINDQGNDHEYVLGERVSAACTVMRDARQVQTLPDGEPVSDLQMTLSVDRSPDDYLTLSALGGRSRGALDRQGIHLLSCTPGNAALAAKYGLAADRYSFVVRTPDFATTQAIMTDAVTGEETTRIGVGQPFAVSAKALAAADQGNGAVVEAQSVTFSVLSNHYACGDTVPRDDRTTFDIEKGERTEWTRRHGVVQTFLPTKTGPYTVDVRQARPTGQVVCDRIQLTVVDVEQTASPELAKQPRIIISGPRAGQTDLDVVSPDNPPAIVNVTGIIRDATRPIAKVLVSNGFVGTITDRRTGETRNAVEADLRRPSNPNNDPMGEHDVTFVAPMVYTPGLNLIRVTVIDEAGYQWAEYRPAVLGVDYKPIYSAADDVPAPDGASPLHLWLNNALFLNSTPEIDSLADMTQFVSDVLAEKGGVLEAITFKDEIDSGNWFVPNTNVSITLTPEQPRFEVLPFDGERLAIHITLPFDFKATGDKGWLGGDTVRAAGNIRAVLPFGFTADEVLGIVFIPDDFDVAPAIGFSSNVEASKARKMRETIKDGVLDVLRSSFADADTCQPARCTEADTLFDAGGNDVGMLLSTETGFTAGSSFENPLAAGMIDLDAGVNIDRMVMAFGDLRFDMSPIFTLGLQQFMTLRRAVLADDSVVLKLPPETAREVLRQRDTEGFRRVEEIDLPNTLADRLADLITTSPEEAPARPRAEKLPSVPRENMRLTDQAVSPGLRDSAIGIAPPRLRSRQLDIQGALHIDVINQALAQMWKANFLDFTLPLGEMVSAEDLDLSNEQAAAFIDDLLANGKVSVSFTVPPRIAAYSGVEAPYLELGGIRFAIDFLEDYDSYLIFETSIVSRLRLNAFTKSFNFMLQSPLRCSEEEMDRLDSCGGRIGFSLVAQRGFDDLMPVPTSNVPAALQRRLINVLLGTTDRYGRPINQAGLEARYEPLFVDVLADALFDDDFSFPLPPVEIPPLSLGDDVIATDELVPLTMTDFEFGPNAKGGGFADGWIQFGFNLDPAE